MQHVNFLNHATAIKKIMCGIFHKWCIGKKSGCNEEEKESSSWEQHLSDALRQDEAKLEPCEVCGEEFYTHSRMICCHKFVCGICAYVITKEVITWPDTDEEEVCIKYICKGCNTIWRSGPKWKQIKQKC